MKSQRPFNRLSPFSEFFRFHEWLQEIESERKTCKLTVWFGNYFFKRFSVGNASLKCGFKAGKTIYYAVKPLVFLFNFCYLTKFSLSFRFI